MYECRTTVGTNEVLQHVQVQVSEVDSIPAVRTNEEQLWVPTKLCNTYGRRTMMLTADEVHVRMLLAVMAADT